MQQRLDQSQRTVDDWNSSGKAVSTDSTSFDKGVPERCLSFELRGPFAHFRRIEGNVVKQTYRIIPRTTAAGLVAAVLGLDRDSYYEIFGPDCSRIAIEPLRELRSIDMPQLALSTNDATMESHGSTRTVKVRLPNPEADRQQHNYEVLVDPAYRIDLWLDNDAVYTDFREYLEQSRSHYTPSLGLSEHLAAVEYLGEFTPEPASDDELVVDSAIPNATDSIVVEPDLQWSVERSPAFMQTNGRGRVTTGFTTYAYRQDAGKITLKDVNVSEVDDRLVMFV